MAMIQLSQIQIGKLMKKILPAKTLFLLLFSFSVGFSPLAFTATESSHSAETGPGHEMKEGFKTTGHGIKHGSKEAGHEIKKGGKAAGRGFKKAGHKIHDTFTD
jgi:hypothetical protein